VDKSAYVHKPKAIGIKKTSQVLNVAVFAMNVGDLSPDVKAQGQEVKLKLPRCSTGDTSAY
jgi:hypothetical protein